MTLGSGIAIASIWIAIAVVVLASPAAAGVAVFAAVMGTYLVCFLA